MYRLIRVSVAIISIIAMTLLFVDFTGIARQCWGWLAKLQFVPAVLAANFIAVAIVAVLTIVFGRLYCSIICPLGIMQDCINWLRNKIGARRTRKNRFKYSAPRTWIRITFLAAFVLCIAFGAMSLAALIEPYSEFGRMVSTYISPLWRGVNNLLADEAELQNSYAFYTVEQPFIHLPALIIAGATLIIIGVWTWIGGRGYCNTVCPVGTVLGFISKWSILKPIIDTTKCNGCRKCERNCKSACIDSKAHAIDYSRCVVCLDCIDNCSSGALKYTWGRGSHQSDSDSKKAQPERRAFIATGMMLAGAAAATAAGKLTDGGLAPIVPKSTTPNRKRIAPPGAVSIDNLEHHCTSCQLCISACPNRVLRPSSSITSFMQPIVEYTSGYCRPECTACSDACPTGAIIKIDTAEKSDIQIGIAVVTVGDCLSATGAAKCGKCSRTCPVGAIEMVPYSSSGNLMPTVNESICIGCGSCEYHCPVNPISAIHVEGYSVHHTR